jgi:hypothetical protein
VSPITVHKLKHVRAIATRYEKHAVNFLALIKLAASALHAGASTKRAAPDRLAGEQDSEISERTAIVLHSLRRAHNVHVHEGVSEEDFVSLSLR